MTDHNDKAHFDLGGAPAGPVDQTTHELEFWEKRVDALLVLLGRPERGLMRTDELRRNIEALGADAYARMSYYERWIASIAHTMLQRGVFTQDELGRRMADIEARQAP